MKVIFYKCTLLYLYYPLYYTLLFYIIRDHLIMIIANIFKIFLKSDDIFIL